MSNQSDKDLTALVIGAGFSGIGSAIQLLKQLGLQADIIEHSSEVGGTWHANTYPGCACDVRSHLYSYSFEPNPNWSESYSQQSEIYAYLRDVANKYDLYKHIQLNTTVSKLEWSAEVNQWKVDYFHNDHPEQKHSKYYHIIFSCTGALRIPKIPIPLRGFAGTVLHTASWDPSVDFRGKSVGLIGNGASGVQIMPYLQKHASHLYNFQRTPSWVVERRAYRYSAFIRTLFTWLPFTMILYRWILYWLYEAYFIVFKYPHSYVARLNTQLLSAGVTTRLRKAGRSDLVPLLLPNYAIGCKRILGSANYYELLAEKNVTVVPYAVDEIDGQTLYSNGQGYEVDILVLATGFEVQEYYSDLTVIGRNGIDLGTLWKTEPRKTFKTFMIHGYPNFFQMNGPGSALGHHSVLETMECEINASIDAVEIMKRYKLNYIEPTEEAQEKFSSQLVKDLKSTVWLLGGCKSWYQDKNGSVNLWSGTVTSFWWELWYSSVEDFTQTQEHENKKLV